MEVCILLIDDHSILLDAMQMLLAARLQNTKIFAASSLHEALINAYEPDIMVLDIKLHGINGLEGIGLLKSKWPNAQVIIMSSQDDMATRQLALDRGAIGFVSKADSSDLVVEMIQSLQHGKLRASQITNTSLQCLTPRQYEVLDLLCRGLSNKMIARQLSLSENTIRRHNQDIFAFFQAASRTEAIFKAKQLGIVR